MKKNDVNQEHDPEPDHWQYKEKVFHSISVPQSSLCRAFGLLLPAPTSRRFKQQNRLDLSLQK